MLAVRKNGPLLTPRWRHSLAPLLIVSKSPLLPVSQSPLLPISKSRGAAALPSSHPSPVEAVPGSPRGGGSGRA